METSFDVLRKSPTFVMSRGGKELFHTNFLAFILENHSKETSKARDALLKCLFECDGGKTPASVTTWRETANLDLVIIPTPESNNGTPCLSGRNDFTAVIIEAKLKSIPTQLQLNTYSEKLRNGIAFEHPHEYVQTVYKSVNAPRPSAQGEYEWNSSTLKLKGDDEGTLIARGKSLGSPDGRNEIIATFKGRIRRILLTPRDIPNIRNGTGWEWLGWEAVAKHTGTTGSGLLPSLLNDYGEHLSQLMALLNDERLQLEVADKTVGQLYEQVVRKQLRDLRIHDLVGKYVFHELEMMILESVETLQNNNFLLNHYTHFSNQQPGVGFEWSLCEHPNKEEGRRLTIGVQIQGDNYRHYVSTNFEFENLSGVADCFSVWMSSSIEDYCFAGKKSRVSPIETHFAFNTKKFLYRQTRITELKLSALSGFVSFSLNSALEALDENKADVRKILGWESVLT